MKELEGHYKEEIKEIAEIKKHKQYLTSRIARPGLKVWEINIETNEVSEATYTDAVVEIRILNMPHHFTQKIVPHAKKDVIRKDNCVYYPAINKKNALKKYEKEKALFSNGV